MARSNNFLGAHLALFAVNIIYGANYVIAKGVMPEKLTPNAFILARVLGATLLFWLIYIFRREKIAAQDFIRIGFCALFGVVINQLFFFNGLNLTSPINASIIMTANPIWVLLLSALILKEKITSKKVSGILIGFAGAATLIILSIDSHRSSSFEGDFFVLINALSYGIYLVLVKPLMKKYKPLTVISWVFLMGTLIVLPIGGRDLYQAAWSEFSAGTLGRISYVVIGVTFLAYLFNIFALKVVSASVTSAYIYLQPVMSVLAAFVFSWWEMENYTNEITWPKILCTAAIFWGVYRVSISSKKSRLK